MPVVLKNGRRAFVRPLRNTDGEALAEMYSAITWGEFRFFCPYPLGRATALRNATERADSDQWFIVVIEGEDGKIGGEAWVRRVPADATQGTFGICIRDVYQNIGTGAALMKRLFEIVKHTGMPTVDLTVQLANHRAVALYQKMGFKIVREQIRPAAAVYGFEAEPEYFMERPTA